MEQGFIRGHERIDEGVILLAIEWAIDIRGIAFVVTGLKVSFLEIDGVFLHDWRGSVKEREAFFTYNLA